MSKRCVFVSLFFCTEKTLIMDKVVVTVPKAAASVPKKKKKKNTKKVISTEVIKIKEPSLSKNPTKQVGKNVLAMSRQEQTMAALTQAIILSTAAPCEFKPVGLVLLGVLMRRQLPILFVSKTLLGLT